jgi:hypothetical protein
MKLRSALPALLGVAALVLGVACSDSEAAPDEPSGSTDAVQMQDVRAPIELAEVAVAESAPAQYYLQIVSGLPGGCARFDRYEVEREADVIIVDVWNRAPGPGAPAACTMIYGYVNHSVPLGNNFESGRAYTVQVNDVTTLFTGR